MELSVAVLFFLARLLSIDYSQQSIDYCQLVGSGGPLHFLPAMVESSVLVSGQINF